MTATLTAPPTATDAPSRVGVLDGLRQTGTLAWRTLARLRHDPSELVGLSVMPIILTLMFTFVFGGAISGDTTSYIQFLLPGILVGNMLFATADVGQGLNSDLSKGVFDRMRALPIARWAPLAGRILAEQFKQVWSILVVLVVGLLLGFRPENGAGGFLAATVLVLLFALASSWVAVWIGVTVKQPEQVSMFSMAVLLPLCFASGQFSPPETMPGWLRWFAEVNPVGVLMAACRGLMNGGGAAVQVAWTLGWIVLMTAVFGWLSVAALRKRV